MRLVQRLRPAGALVAVVSALALAAPAAAADSGSLTVADAGGGNMVAYVDATVTDCPHGPEYCFWYVTLEERHSTLPCVEDKVFIRGSAHSYEPTTIHRTWIFQPFFPRSARLCLYLHGTGAEGRRLLDEELYVVPPGYGWHRSVNQWCDDFRTQAAAQYYLYLYPDDPSLLDYDGDGAACNWNDCPCGAHWIPPEPQPTPPPSMPVFAPSPAPRGPSLSCIDARADERRAQGLVKAANRGLRNARRPVAKGRWRQKLKKRKTSLRRAKAQVAASC